MTGHHPLPVQGIDHVVLKITDIDRALRFYVGVLGLNLERVIEDLQIYQLRCGRNLLDLVACAARDLAPPAERGMEHLCLRVATDSATIRAHLAGHGVAIAAGPVEVYGATGFGTSVYVLDPDGHRIELKSWHSDQPQRLTLAGVPMDPARSPGDR